MEFIAIHFETANRNNNSACSIGLVYVKNNEIVNKRHYFIQPPIMEFDKKNVEVHGITQNDVKHSPKFSEVWEDIQHYFMDNIIVAHNAQFDMSVLKCLQIEYDLELPDFEYICSIPISTAACPGIGTSMKDRAEYLGINMGNHHNALDDATTCANIVTQSVASGKINSFRSFIEENNLPIRRFSKLKHQSYFGKRKNRFQNINISDIIPENDVLENQHHPFNKKNFVFTGNLANTDRKDAMQMVVNLGGFFKSGVSRTTDFLIVGIQDKSLVGDDGISSKERKAFELLSKGFNIEIINEEQFFDLFSFKSF